MSTTAPPALRLSAASKRFGGVQALDDVDLTVNVGEVQALLGENGSGKSTLVKILAGYHAPEQGARLELWGEEIDLPITAPQEHGVAVIHQDLGLVESMSVFENFGITSGYDAKVLMPINMKAERGVCKSLLDEMELDVDLDAPVRALSPAQRAGLAIARATRALRRHGVRHIFLVDEPTTYLSAEEASRMLELIHGVARRGSSVIFVTHRLQEALAVSDSITVLRDGKVADHFSADGTDQHRIITAMLGRDIERFYPEPVSSSSDTAKLRVRDLRGERLRSISFDLHPGEVVGIGGLVGSGHDEIPYLLSGARKTVSGSAYLGSEDILTLSLRDRLGRGVLLIPANRQRDGLWMTGTARENISLPHLKEFTRVWALRLHEERRQSKTLMERLGVRPLSTERAANQFSGGNQQKIVLAKWLYTTPEVLLLDEPTQGIDAGAKKEILDLIVKLADQGTAVAICSGDYEQLANVCNRVLIVRDGVIAAELHDPDITEDRITQEAHRDEPAGN
jgi:ribose transport system ATP-binding protein